jgi:hypothetical protein
MIETKANITPDSIIAFSKFQAYWPEVKKKIF